MNITDSIKNFFSIQKIASGFDHAVVGIDIGSSSIKIVEIEKVRGKAVLKTYGELALGPYSGLTIGSIANLANSKLSEALHDILLEAKTTTPNSGMSIPFKSSLVSLIEMPNLPVKQLEEMIPIEARKYIPVPIAEVTLDWWIVPKESKPDPKNPKDKTDVLVVSIHNEILSDYNNIVRSNNLNTSFFEIEMFSSTRSLVDNSAAPSMVIDMGASGTKLYVVEKGVLKNSHIFNKGSQDITHSLSKGLSVSQEEAEKIKRNLEKMSKEDRKRVEEIVSLTVDGILAETKSFMQNYKVKYERDIKKIILTGGGVALFGFGELAKKTFGDVDIVMGDSFAKVETPAYLQETLRTTGLQFAVAVGIALRKLQEIE